MIPWYHTAHPLLRITLFPQRAMFLRLSVTVNRKALFFNEQNFSFHTFGAPIVPFEEENEKQINWKERKMITQACKRLRTRDI